MNKFTALALALLALPTVVSAAEVSLATPPYIYTGRIMNYVGQGMDVAAEGAVIRAYKDKGKTLLLATAEIRTEEGMSNNFCLSIPMTTSTDETVEAAHVGDNLTFEVDDGTTIFEAPSEAFGPVGNPGRSTTLRLLAATDANGDGIADEYAAIIQDELDSNHPAYGKAYDGAADYDGDGMSNYDEYLAGTNPLTAGDTLAFQALESASSDGLLKADFMSATGRVYGIVAAETPNGFTDAHEPFKLKDEINAPDKTTYNEEVGSEIRTIYLLKSGDSRFYKLRLL